MGDLASCVENSGNGDFLHRDGSNGVLEFEEKEVKQQSMESVNGYIHRLEKSTKLSKNSIDTSTLPFDTSSPHIKTSDLDTPSTSDLPFLPPSSNSSRPQPPQNTSNIASSDAEFDGSDLNPEYELFAVVVHSGKSGNGHFTTYRKKLKHERSDTKWVRCSDNHVVGVTIDEVKRCEAYILFYELLISPPPH
eukprot:TRINITY_DN2838_c0_g1_i1.p1 TRINITY_DN2838_c0_g1~~TRINITY_DN2838_c0_g1_i1.p1  ORF type:complete len:192 (+),score=26.77 TRINITY_DN2838_c0_g1_i1:611-1186(+)